MKKWDLKPTVSIGKVRFQAPRAEVRNQVGSSFREIKKNIFSKNTMDAYESFHVFYSESNEMEAIEFFGGNKLTLNGKTLFPGTISNAQQMISDLTGDESGYISKKMSIGIAVSEDDPTVIDSVLVGCLGYYGSYL